MSNKNVVIRESETPGQGYQVEVDGDLLGTIREIGDSWVEVEVEDAGEHVIATVSSIETGKSVARRLAGFASDPKVAPAEIVSDPAPASNRAQTEQLCREYAALPESFWTTDGAFNGPDALRMSIDGHSDLRGVQLWLTDCHLDTELGSVIAYYMDDSKEGAQEVSARVAGTICGSVLDHYREQYSRLFLTGI